MCFIECTSYRYERRLALQARFEIEQKLRKEKKKLSRGKDKQRRPTRDIRSRQQDKSKSKAMDELKAKRSAGSLRLGVHYNYCRFNHSPEYNIIIIVQLLTSCDTCNTCYIHLLSLFKQFKLDLLLGLPTWTNMAPENFYIFLVIFCR